MKLKIVSFLVVMMAVLAVLASCNFGTPDGPDGPSDLPPGDDKYPWKSAEILVQLYENSANDELSSGLKRYYAGEDSAAFDEIDDLVRDRNAKAEAITKVDAKYSYETSFTWGASKQQIQTLAKSGTAAAPDVFCNFAYDITACQLRGCFANLLSNSGKTTQTHGDSGNNFFRFSEDGYVGTSDNYFDSNAGEGYFYDYMQSLAFANSAGQYDKLYCLASNYCTDLVRAFLVVPVNIQMLEEIVLDASTGDSDGDGDFDLEDFYKDVWDYKWTYEALATLSQAVYNDTNKDIAGADLADDKLGFAAGRGSGLTGSGILYTTSVKIIEKYQKNDGTWSYRYPTTNQSLVDISTELAKLFGDNSGKGICAVNPDSAKASGFNTGELQAIRTRFSENHVLFGGVIAVGSLEDEVYQKMNASKGFGIVPVPLYTQTYTDDTKSTVDKEAEGFQQYLTLVHNLARIVTIGVGTGEFQQCSAFLDYQSRNSAEILEKYYTEDLTAKVEGGEAGDHNKKMLTYIRNHVRDCFDKTYEDVISAYQEQGGDKNAMQNRWHHILYSHDYNITDMSIRYDANYPNKQKLLEEVLVEWAAIGNTAVAE